MNNLPKKNILIVDDELGVRESLQLILEDDYNLFIATNGYEAVEIYKNSDIDIVLLDIRMPGMDGMQTLAELEKIDPIVEVVMVTATATIDIAIETIKNGALNYITKPFEIDDLMVLVKRAINNRFRNKNQSKLMDETFVPPLITAKSMITVLECFNEVIKDLKPVIISGSFGTEKEDLAKSIYSKSEHKHIFMLNCFENEKFQNEIKEIIETNQEQKIDFLDNTTIVFNTIEKLNKENQKFLLEYFYDKEKNIINSSRIISITSHNLNLMIENKILQKELFEIIKGQNIVIPDLSERKQDFEEIIYYYLDNFNQYWGKNIKLEKNALACLASYDWPGNTIELSNIINRIVLITKNSIKKEFLPLYLISNSKIESFEEEFSISKFAGIFRNYYLNEVLHAKRLKEAQKELEQRIKERKNI